MAQLNKDKYTTLKEARKAYRKWQEGCTKLNWCVLPFDEWLYDSDRSAEMERGLSNAERRVMNMELRNLSLDEVIEQLTKLKEMNPKADLWKLRIVLSDGRKLCVGKILGVANDKTGEATAYMFPVPENIESLNELSKLMTMLTCEKSAKGQECGSCPNLPTCPQMKAIDESLRHMAEGRK